MTSPLHKAIYLTGPTACGKTAIGVELARRLDAEVVAMDSMTLYRGMDIGTAKPNLAERGGVPHHLIDVIDPWESASVADYREWAIQAVKEVESRGHRALFVGGTALYLKALLRGLFEGPPADPGLRNSLEEEADRLGNAALHGRLAKLDPKTAARLPIGDRRRIVRALEVIHSTGMPLSDLQKEHERPAEGVRVFAIDRPSRSPAQTDRIDRREVRMFADGLIEEAQSLISGPQPLNQTPLQGVGYGEVIDHLQGRCTLGRAIELTQNRTRQFAKRQRTWFRGLEECRAWPIPEDEPAEVTADHLAEEIRNLD